jgi:hypothetical protein
MTNTWTSSNHVMHRISRGCDLPETLRNDAAFIVDRLSAVYYNINQARGSCSDGDGDSDGDDSASKRSYIFYTLSKGKYK